MLQSQRERNGIRVLKMAISISRKVREVTPFLNEIQFGKYFEFANFCRGAGGTSAAYDVF